MGRIVIPRPRVGKQRFFREGVQLKPRTTGKFGDKEMDFLLGAIDQAVMIGSRLYKEGSQGSLGSGAEKAQEQGSARIAAVDARKQQLMKSGLREHDAWLQARKEVMASEGARSDAAEAALGETGPKSAAYEGFTGSLSGRQPDNFALAQPERVQPLGAGTRAVATGRIAPEEEYESGLLAGAQAYRDQAAVPGTEAYREKWSREGQAVAASPGDFRTTPPWQQSYWSDRGQAVAESPTGRLSSWENPENLPPMVQAPSQSPAAPTFDDSWPVVPMRDARSAMMQAYPDRWPAHRPPTDQEALVFMSEMGVRPPPNPTMQLGPPGSPSNPTQLPELAPITHADAIPASPPQAQPQQVAQPQQPPPRTPEELAAKQHLTNLPPERQSRVVAAAKQLMDQQGGDLRTALLRVAIAEQKAIEDAEASKSRRLNLFGKDEGQLRVLFHSATDDKQRLRIMQAVADTAVASGWNDLVLGTYKREAQERVAKGYRPEVKKKETPLSKRMAELMLTESKIMAARGGERRAEELHAPNLKKMAEATRKLKLANDKAAKKLLGTARKIKKSGGDGADILDHLAFFTSQSDDYREKKGMWSNEAMRARYNKAIPDAELPAIRQSEWASGAGPYRDIRDGAGIVAKTTSALKRARVSARDQKPVVSAASSAQKSYVAAHKPQTPGQATAVSDRVEGRSESAEDRRINDIKSRIDKAKESIANYPEEESYVKAHKDNIKEWQEELDSFGRGAATPAAGGLPKYYRDKSGALVMSDD